MKSKKPLFSIIIPAHNEEEVIERAVKSVQNQTFQDFEIIISNDGSKDKTKEIVENLMKKDNRIKILNRDKGTSAAYARNRGAEKAKGEILVFLDADTLINNIFLEEINKKKSIADAFITVNFPLRKKFISKILAGFIGPSKKTKLKEGKIYDKTNADEAGKMFFCVTKKAYDSIRGYDEHVFYYEDESFINSFYEKGFKSTLVKKAQQYYELPSNFLEFRRQCKWIGRGINSIKDKRQKNKQKEMWFAKTLFLLSPLAFLWNLNLFLTLLIITAGISYLSLVIRNKKPILSLAVLPFLYIKTILVIINLFRFWKN